MAAGDIRVGISGWVYKRVYELMIDALRSFRQAWRGAILRAKRHLLRFKLFRFGGAHGYCAGKEY